MNKRFAIILLVTIDILILISGIFLTISNYVNNIEYKIFNTTLPGFLLGVVVIFIGARYFRSILRMKKNIYSNNLSFSWGNFKKQKKVLK